MSLQDSVLGDDGALAVVAPATRPVRPAVVRVNLVPPEIAAGQRLRRVQVGLGAAVLLTAAGVGLLSHQQAGAVSRAHDQLTAAKADNARLVATQAALGNVNALYAKVDAADAMLAAAKGPQVLWSRYLEDVRLRLPEKTWLTTLSFLETPPATVATVAVPSAAKAAGTGTPGVGGAAATGTAATGTTATGTTPAGPACNGTTPIGTVAVTGSGYTHKDVADWLDRLAGLKAVTNTYLANSVEALVGESVPTVTWSSSASLTCEALVSAGKK